jgi:hypothetical protein
MARRGNQSASFHPWSQQLINRVVIQLRVGRGFTNDRRENYYGQSDVEQ